MGYGSAALFTQAVPKVNFLSRTRAKAKEGLAAAIKQVRSPTAAARAEVGDYEHDLATALRSAGLGFVALTENFELKREIFDQVEAARRSDAIVATVTSGLSIGALCQGRGDSFRRHFLGLHFFNPPNVIVGTELIANRDSDAAVLDFVEAFARLRLGRAMSLLVTTSLVGWDIYRAIVDSFAAEVYFLLISPLVPADARLSAGRAGPSR